MLLDRNELTSGSTFHSAGLVGQLRSSLSLTRMMMDSVELYRTLDCGWVECGGIRLACTAEREQEVLRQVAWAQDVRAAARADLGRARRSELFPLMVTDGVRCASYLATRRLPRPVAADHARWPTARAAGGCRIFTHTRVTGDRRRRDGPRARACRPSGAPIEAEVVVNAGGMFAAEIGRMAGVRVPIVPVRARVPRHAAVPRARGRGASTCRRCATPTC